MSTLPADPPVPLIAGENARIVHVRREGEPSLVEGKFCPFGCYDLCMAPEICEVSPEKRTPMQHALVAGTLAAVEEDALRSLAEEAAEEASSPDPAEQEAYLAHWKANRDRGITP